MVVISWRTANSFFSGWAARSRRHLSTPFWVPPRSSPSICRWFVCPTCPQQRIHRIFPQTELPVVANALSEQVRSIVTALRTARPPFMKMTVVKQKDPLELHFLRYLPEDKVCLSFFFIFYYFFNSSRALIAFAWCWCVLLSNCSRMRRPTMSIFSATSTGACRRQWPSNGARACRSLFLVSPVFSTMN